MKPNTNIPDNAIKTIVIVGGGSAGWMTAAALSRHLPDYTQIKLVESDQIATVGVGEATIPAIRTFNAGLGINEKEFMRETNATFKLSIRFENWGKIGDAYNHAFGFYGYPIDDIPFHNYWLKYQDQLSTNIHDYNLAYQACDADKFAHVQFDMSKPDSRYFYAYQFDATLYAQYLRKQSESRGVQRVEGKVITVDLHKESGCIQSIQLESGEQITGDLFIDCSGFRSLLIHGALDVGFDDWSHWLPVNRAWAMSTAYPSNDAAIPPYTRARALTAGWQWRIPLQNRTGDGNVFSKDFISEEAALEQFHKNVEGEPLPEPRLLKFTAGKRSKLWEKNCVAIGLSGGFLEPLESTSIYLIQAAILQFIRNFPDKTFQRANQDEFNAKMAYRYEDARNFLILHYHATEREDTEFWKYCKNMQIPDELAHKITLFKQRGYVAGEKLDLFSEHSWLAVYFGQGVTPSDYDHRVNKLDPHRAIEMLNTMYSDVQDSLNKMPTHNQTLAEFCPGELISSKSI
ncbi:MAG: tryptophan halogenase family protein [bacterium]